MYREKRVPTYTLLWLSLISFSTHNSPDKALLQQSCQINQISVFIVDIQSYPFAELFVFFSCVAAFLSTYINNISFWIFYFIIIRESAFAKYEFSLKIYVQYNTYTFPHF